MKLYNTASRQVEEVRPQSPPTVTVYSCGPTVYDYPHIGNWFTFIRYDLLIRTLKLKGWQPTWAMNITDVGHLASDADEGEDKLEKGAKREGKTAWEVAQFYTDYFVEGLKRLNIASPTHLPKATDHIAEQIELIKKLEAKGYIYVIDDGVYYDTAKFPKYGEFAQLKLDDQQAGARVGYNSQKRNISDFALWKFSPKGQKRDMEWDSPWGKGFPGWHLECSAMAMKYLGDTVDIHAGGIDHIPVHHTNEIAQSQAVTGKPLANYWMHTNHITIEGEKIAKSLGNGITLEDIEAKGYSLEALRLMVLESHYRSQSKFSWENLEAGQNRLKTWQNFADLRFQYDDLARPFGVFPAGYYKNQRLKIQAAVEKDLGTPEALKIISEAIDEIGEYKVELLELEEFEALIDYLDQLFGLRLMDEKDISEKQKQLINEREVVRLNKDWSKSDAIRDQLAKDGIGVRDTARGAIWYRL